MNGMQLTELEQRIRTDYSNIAGMVVRKDGKAVYDGCFGGCTPDSRIHVFSVSLKPAILMLPFPSRVKFSRSF